MLDFGRMRTLLAVAECGSMTGAATLLRCTQPGVSRQVAALERQAGVPLVIRTPTGVRLTPAGELLVEHARSITDRLNRAQRQLTQLAGVADQPLRIGSFSSANAALVPAGLREYIRRHPQYPVPLLPVTDPEQHLPELRAGKLDLALVTEWDLHRQDLDGMDLIPLAEDELLLALGRDHPFAQRQVRLADLRNDAWIEGAHPDCLGPLEGLLGSFGHAPAIDIHCDDWTGKQALVASGTGVMFFPALARQSARPDIVLRRLTDEIPRRRIYLAVPTGATASGPVGALVDVLRSVGRQHNG